MKPRMTVEDDIMRTLCPGVLMTINGCATTLMISNDTAQKSLRSLYKRELLIRHRHPGTPRKLLYEGTQRRLA